MNTLSFSVALSGLKRGHKVARSGWNDKGTYVQLRNGMDMEHAVLNAYFTIKNAKNSFDIWVPSVSDILAEDWGVVE